MATKEIKNRIVLEGEKEYNAALKEANRNLKTLKSELKAETAELGRNATEQQKNETRVKNLRKQIAEQEKVVKTYEKALEEVRQKYGDNEDAIASWEQKLNNARATLGNMKNDLDGLGDGLAEVEKSSELAVVATASIADAMGKIGDAGSAVADTIEGIFSNMVDIATEAVGELWTLISETAAKANNWTDIAGYWNTDAQEIQKWARAVNAAQNDFGDLQNAVSKIVLGDHDKIAKMTGVSYVGGMDEWKYAMDVLSSISSMEHQARNSALSEIFGEKRATKMMDLLNDWGTITGMLEEFNGNESGFGMSDKELETMDQLWVQIGKVEEKWTALKENVAGGLGTVALDLMVNAEGALNGIADFLNAENEEEREAALEKVRTNAEEFFRRVGEALQEAVKVLAEVGAELEGSDDPVVSAIGGILSGLTDTLQWMIDNQEAVKGAFEAIFGFWLLAKLAAVGGKLSAILLQIQAIQAFKGLGGLGGAAAAGGAASGAASGAATGATGAGWLGGLIKGATPNLLAAVGIHELAKLLPANLLTPQTDAQKALDEVNQAHGINALGDVEQKLAETDQEQNRRTLDFIADTLLHPGKQLEDAADTLQGAAEVIEEEEDVTPESGLLLSPQDRALYEDVWDQRGFGEDGEAYQRMQEMFEGNEALFDELIARLEGLYESGYQGENLPEWWFDSWPSAGNNSGSDGITSSDLQGFRGLPAQLQRAAQAGTAAGVSGIRVYMDSVAVGHLVAPTVSQDIAAAI